MRQAAREEGAEYDSSFAGVETGEPCAKCKGTGTVEGDIWPGDMDDWPTIPATVLDPFVGSGTTLVVARQLGRSGVGLDLSLDYLSQQARKRLGLDKLATWGRGMPPIAPRELDDLPLFSMEASP